MRLAQGLREALTDGICAREAAVSARPALVGSVSRVSVS